MPPATQLGSPRDGDVLPQAAGAVAVTSEIPHILTMLHELSEYAHVPMPRVWLQHDNAPNAMATGSRPDQSAVTISTGALQVLDERELRAVLAHEVGHIAHGHVADKTAAAVQLARRAGLISTGAFGGGLALTHLFDQTAWAGLGATLAGAVAGGIAGNAAHRRLAALTRHTELEADTFAAHAGGSAISLASALRKLEVAMARLHAQVPDWQRTLGIIEPDDVYATHPPTLTRIGALPADPSWTTTTFSCPSCWFGECADAACCRRCGSQLRSQSCSGCQASVDAADRVCRRCGTRRLSTRCWLCAASITTGDLYCSSCGEDQSQQTTF